MRSTSRKYETEMPTMHWTPIAGWHNCSAPVVVKTTNDGTTVTRPECKADEEATK